MASPATGRLRCKARLGKEAPVNSKSATKAALSVQIRWMIRRDMAEVLQIERSSFEYHWTEADFLHCLRQRNCIGMVAEHGNRVVGFMIYELFKNRLHILNFAVAPEQTMDDGHLTVTVFSRYSKIQLWWHFLSIAFAKRAYSPKSIAFRVRSLRIDGPKKQPVHLDGTPQKGLWPLKIECRPGQLAVFAPAA